MNIRADGLRGRIDWKAERDRIDLAAVAKGLLGPPTGRRGERGLWWRCPLGTHRDDNPSFRVARDRAGHWRWRCFGCGMHGDAAALVTAVRNCSFREAVAYLTGGSVAPDKPRPSQRHKSPPHARGRAAWDGPRGRRRAGGRG